MTATQLALNARGHLSSETIDLLLLSALAAAEANAAKEHLDACNNCRTRWRELNEDKEKFEQFVFARTLPRIEERVAKASKSPLAFLSARWLVPALGLAAAAGIAFVFVGSGPGTQTEDDIYIGTKGPASLDVYAQRASGQAFRVKAGDSLKPGDRIRFVVNPGDSKARYVLVVSKDATGAFSVYHPFGATESQQLETQVPRRVELNGSVELDDTLGAEQLWLVLSPMPLKAAEVEAALKANALPSGVSVVKWNFVKEAR